MLAVSLPLQRDSEWLQDLPPTGKVNRLAVYQYAVEIEEMAS
jgi:hypothetical protein